MTGPGSEAPFCAYCGFALSTVRVGERASPFHAERAPSALACAWKFTLAAEREG